MPGFLEDVIPSFTSYGTEGSLSYTTIVVTNPSRKETRFPQQSRGYWNLTIKFTDKTKSIMQAIHHHYAAVQGKAYGWRFRNLREYYTCTDNYASGTIGKEPIPSLIDNTHLQLVHTRNPTKTTAEVVPIKKPDLSIPIVLYRDGSLTAYSAANYTVDLTTGIVTFTSSQAGHTFEWLGYWDTPVRFDFDSGLISWTDFDVFDWDSITVKEIQV